jgi:hypothetical protein
MVRDDAVWEGEFSAKNKQESGEDSDLDVERSKILPDECE